MARSAERVTVEWLRAVVPSADGKVATRIPAEHTPAPFVVVTEIGGGDTGVRPVDRPYVQVDCIHATSRSAADDIALDVIDAAKDAWPWSSTVEAATVLAVDVVAKRAVIEPESGWHRFAVDLLITIRED